MKKILSLILGSVFFSVSLASFSAQAQDQSPAAKKGRQEELQPKKKKKSAPSFTPPKDSDIPNNEFGKMVRRGKDIFMNTHELAKPYVGNSLNCVNCHLNQGRLENSSPMWAAYVLYPSYRKKTNKVDTMQDRIQGCFMYSMNGKAPPQDSEIMTALVTYQYWMATGAPTGVELKGRGYPELAKPKRKPSWDEGQKVYLQNCSVCHGGDGQGQYVDGKTVFPPLWGAQSYNWGAGMHRINTAASFIKANMPLGQAGRLSDQEAWDVAYYINAQQRPPDPRMKGSLSEADKEFHDEDCLFGEKIHGVELGARK